MRKNGFTLIELLAVIVILAIIALIATPIILGIINDAREKANERSVELYASAVRNGIAAYQLVDGKEVSPNTYTKDTLPFTVEYDGNVECTEIIISDDSKVSLKGCTVNGGEKTYNYGIVEERKPCNYIDMDDDGMINLSDEVTCGTESFYVVSSTNESIRMLRKDIIGIGTYTSTEYGVISYENSELYPVMQSYENRLRDELGLKDVSTTFLSVGEAGCDSVDGCSEEYNGFAPEWIYSTTYWLITTHDQGHYLIDKEGYYNFGMPDCEIEGGIRPVVIMSINNI